MAINSLTSPGMVAGTLAGMARGGRVTEISKRDIWSPQRIAQERPDIRYNLIAVDFLTGPVCLTILFFAPLVLCIHCCLIKPCRCIPRNWQTAAPVQLQLTVATISTLKGSLIWTTMNSGFRSRYAQ